MENCLFCRIASHELKANFIYEDDNVMAILDIHPSATGHTMVIPKVHAKNMLEIEDSAIPELFATVKKVLHLLKDSLSPNGFTIGINHGKISGQEIDHLHIHLIPRYEGDRGNSVQSVVNFSAEDRLSGLKKLILKNN